MSSNEAKDVPIRVSASPPPPSTNSTSVPTDADIRDAISLLLDSGLLTQTTGVEKFKAAIKQQHPTWENITSKRVRVILKEVIEEINHIDGEFGVDDRVGVKGGGKRDGRKGFGFQFGFDGVFEEEVLGEEMGTEEQQGNGKGDGENKGFTGMNRRQRRKMEKERRKSEKAAKTSPITRRDVLTNLLGAEPDSDEDYEVFYDYDDDEDYEDYYGEDDEGDYGVWYYGPEAHDEDEEEEDYTANIQGERIMETC